MNLLRKLATTFLDRLSSGIAKRLAQSPTQYLNEEQVAQLTSSLAKDLPVPAPTQPLRQYLGDGEIFVQTHYFHMIVPGWDVSLTPTILASSQWEAGLSECLKGKVKPGMIAFDVGANMGWFSSLFASLGAAVHAFEPNPRLQRILRKNIFLNAGHRAAKCTVNQCAIGSSQAVVAMRFPHWLAGGAGLHDFDQTPFLDSLIDHEITTNVTTLDSHAREMNIQRVDIIKIDIEGHEEEALLGATDLIRRSPGLILSIEYTRGRYSSAFPSWLFERFGEAYLPALGREIDIEFLKEYEASIVLPECTHIDVVLVAK